MATIRAPFNFVPLANKVFTPNWADQISQDIPFSDGMSGIIELTIIAESPIFVRNGHTKKDADDKNDTYKSFSKTNDGRYFIPATSIKGAIRNVLEIMSFGKMNFIQNESFGIRDLSNGGVDGTFYRDKIKTENIHCGWLRQEHDKYFLDDCGLPWRISEDEIDNKYGCGLEDFVKTSDFKKDENRTAKAKYELMGNHSLNNSFLPDDDLRNSHKVGNRLFMKFGDNGESGTIVLTGQPGRRKQGPKINKKGEHIWENKYYEFIIPDKKEKENIEVDEFIIDEFISIHKNSPDFKDFRKGQLLNGERIPVFFMYDENKMKVDSLGLSYMYKYPAFNSIYNGIPEDFLSKDKHDLADCIFGYTYTLGKDSLRGRVQFTNAFAIGQVKECPQIKFALSAPNPSYCPLYLGNGQTWNSEKISIAGRKRYPTRNNIISNVATDAMTSYAIPLDKETQFKGKLVFHNLRKMELGSILSALTFHEENGCYHNIGQGKPLGYGKVKIEAKIKEITNNLSKKELLDAFENAMNAFVNGDWRKQSSIIELLAMAKGIPLQKEDNFTYMKMSTNRADNEFLTGRSEYSNGSQLGLFTQIINDNVPKCAFVGNVQSNQQRINEEKILEQKYQNEIKFDNLLDEAKGLIEQNEFNKALDIINEAEKLSFRKNDKVQAIRDEINSKIDELKSNFNKLKSEADALFNNKEYERASESYNKASQYGLENFKYQIMQCVEMINMKNTIANSSIEEFLSTIKLASIEAFAGSLRKRDELIHIKEEDIISIANFLKEQIPVLKKDKQKNWLNEKKWSSISKIVGEEKAQTIFNMIKK